MRKFLICIGLALSLSACSTDHAIRFDFNPQQNAQADPSYKGRSHFFFWGIAQQKNYNMQNVCPIKGVNTIENYWTLYDSLMGGLTMGIYAPESYAIYCN